ncbi:MULTISPECIES: hypothetical protein [Tenacibaculum]|uniref:hypothetical protein n=3 Tax=Flavobacteriaceae TaxID=49546 RepID=UPI00187B1AB8|nr:MULTISPECIES: hypothetical protein [Tenacibaculum]MCD8449470.1 hypothetical protein [Tenacibaculum dicentrarchi]MBE7661069.1 hypothetical protein [Tenacibaculum finnmarkense genomovar finnmarkense]MBE7671599.1 hypothetical protein [Tenacibaculum piscium]MBE7686489.1 hypothetical protein [Tenacibaculum piscium]MBE7691203.1 hypothetical protein [Tenacibaculum piscium]
MEGFVRAINSVSKKALKTSIGKVTEITETTCTVEREHLSELLDVRLNAVVGDFESSFIVYPKINSEVLVVEIENNPQETAIIKYTEIDRVTIQIDEFEVDCNKQGLSVGNKGESFKTIVNDLIDELNKILVIQGNTINVPAMNAIKKRFNKVLK